MCGCMTGGLHAQPAIARLPRSVFDVIPPAERVIGTRGGISVLQSQCRVGDTRRSRRRIVDIAAQEWAAFGFQTVDSTQVENRALPPGIVPDSINPSLPAPRIVPRFPRLGDSENMSHLDATIAGYWSATPEASFVLAEQNAAWNAPGGGAVNWVQPWSAAFVSWVMCEAGLGDMAQFQRSVAHRLYIDQAIMARDGNAPAAAYVAYDAGETPIEPGDLLCRSRANTDYRRLADRRRDLGMSGATHCDIVVKVNEPGGRIFGIGGNVYQSVSLTILPARRDGARYMRPIDESIIEGAQTIFAHLKLKADSIEVNALDNSPTLRAPDSSWR